MVLLYCLEFFSKGSRLQLVEDEPRWEAPQRLLGRGGGKTRTLRLAPRLGSPRERCWKGEDAAVLACSALGPARLGVLWGRRPGRSHGLPQQPPETSPAEHMSLKGETSRLTVFVS